MRKAIISRKDEWIFQIGAESGLGQNQFEVAVKPSYSFFGGGKVTTGVWTHIASVWDGETLRIYINGNRSRTYMATKGYIQPTGNKILIGNREDTSAFFNGNLDEISIYNRALGEREIDHRSKHGEMLTWPVAVIASPTTDGDYSANTNISFDGSSSFDRNGDGIQYYWWDFGDGTPEFKTSSTTTNHKFTSAGTYKISLAVGDPPGWSTGQAIIIIVK